MENSFAAEWVGIPTPSVTRKHLLDVVTPTFNLVPERWRPEDSEFPGLQSNSALKKQSGVGHGDARL